MPSDLTPEEKRALAALRRLEKIWPPSLWIFAGGHHGLAVLKKGKDGRRVMRGGSQGSVDPDYAVDHFPRIESDGGDW